MSRNGLLCFCLRSLCILRSRLLPLDNMHRRRPAISQMPGPQCGLPRYIHRVVSRAAAQWCGLELTGYAEAHALQLFEDGISYELTAIAMPRTDGCLVDLPDERFVSRKIQQLLTFGSLPSHAHSLHLPICLRNPA